MNDDCSALIFSEAGEVSLDVIRHKLSAGLASFKAAWLFLTETGDMDPDVRGFYQEGMDRMSDILAALDTATQAGVCTSRSKGGQA